MQAFIRPNFLQAFGRPGALSVGVAFGGLVCLTRPASEVCTFVLGFHSVGWVQDGKREAANVHGGLGYKCAGGTHVSYIVFN